MSIEEAKQEAKRQNMFLGLVCAITLVLMVIVAVSMPKKQTVTLYQDEIVCVTRSNGSISVLDAQTGEEYTYTTQHVRRPKNAAETAKTLLETKSFTIQAVGSMLIVVEPGNTVYIRL